MEKFLKKLHKDPKTTLQGVIFKWNIDTRFEWNGGSEDGWPWREDKYLVHQRPNPGQCRTRSQRLLLGRSQNRSGVLRPLLVPLWLLMPILWAIWFDWHSKLETIIWKARVMNPFKLEAETLKYLQDQDNKLNETVEWLAKILSICLSFLP